VPVRREEFERLYAEHARPLLAFLDYRTGNRALAEDLLAETFEKAYRARHRYDPRRGRHRTWVYAIARNCLRDHARRRATEERAMAVTAAGAPSSYGLEHVEDRDAVHRALHGLSAEEREAVALRYGADLTVPEIASVIGEPLTTAEGRIYRALRKLRDELSE